MNPEFCNGKKVHLIHCSNTFQSPATLIIVKAIRFTESNPQKHTQTLSHTLEGCCSQSPTVCKRCSEMENFNRIKRKTFSFHLEIPQIPPFSPTLVLLPLFSQFSLFPRFPLLQHLQPLLYLLNIPPPPPPPTICRNHNLLPSLSPFHSISLTLSLSRSLSLFLFVLLLWFCSSSFRKQTDQSLGPSSLLQKVLSPSLCHSLFVDLFPVSCHVQTLLFPSGSETHLHTWTHKYTQSHTTGINHLRRERHFQSLGGFWTLGVLGRVHHLGSYTHTKTTSTKFHELKYDFLCVCVLIWSDSVVLAIIIYHMTSKWKEYSKIYNTPSESFSYNSNNHKRAVMHNVKVSSITHPKAVWLFFCGTQNQLLWIHAIIIRHTENQS